MCRYFYNNNLKIMIGQFTDSNVNEARKSLTNLEKLFPSNYPNLYFVMPGRQTNINWKYQSTIAVNEINLTQQSFESVQGKNWLSSDVRSYLFSFHLIKKIHGGICTGVILNFYWGAKNFFYLSLPPDCWKIGTKKHCIRTNLTLFIVPFFLFSLFFLFFLFFSFSLGATSPSPPQMTPLGIWILTK